jgi:hypothetical protein
VSGEATINQKIFLIWHDADRCIMCFCSLNRPTGLKSPQSVRLLSFRRSHRHTVFQNRGILTAITYTPPSKILPTNEACPPNVLTQLLDVTLAWATKDYQKTNDKITHALVLVSKTLVPQGIDNFRQACSASPNLSAVKEHVVAVVDCVGDGTHGITALITTNEQRAAFQPIPGPELQELRVGRWHAKEVEQEETKEFNFQDVLASIRQNRKPFAGRPVAEGNCKHRNHLVIALGNMYSLTSLSTEIKKKYLRADIVQLLAILLILGRDRFDEDTNDEFALFNNPA